MATTKMGVAGSAARSWDSKAMMAAWRTAPALSEGHSGNSGVFGKRHLRWDVGRSSIATSLDGLGPVGIDWLRT